MGLITRLWVLETPDGQREFTSVQGLLDWLKCMKKSERKASKVREHVVCPVAELELPADDVHGHVGGKADTLWGLADE